MSIRKALAAIATLWLFALIGFVALGWRSSLPPITPPRNFDTALVKRGAQLAAIGDCHTCHTAVGGRSFAGGLAVPTPFGTIYSTNITPDPDTGIGRWSEASFRRAMPSDWQRFAPSHISADY
jgi:mono/diheme cytochrome c family protein